MPARIVYLRPDRHSYINTDVPFNRSIDQIKKMLIQNGCSRIIVQEDLRGKIPIYILGFERDQLPYIIEFPVVYERLKGGERLRMDLSGRIIHDRVKALLIEVEINASPFSAAMLQFMAIRDQSTGQITQMENYIISNSGKISTPALFLTGIGGQ